MRSENFGDLLTVGFRVVFLEETQVLSVMQYIYDEIVESNNSFVKDTSMTGLGGPTELNGKIDYHRGYQGYDTTVNFPEIVDGFKIERKLKDDGGYGIMNRYPRELGIEFHRHKEEQAENIFTEGFSYAPTDGDAKALFATDHPSSADASYSESNKGTVALSPASLSSERVSLFKTKNARGKRKTFIGDRLFVPIDLKDTAQEIAKSVNKAHEMSNTYNVHHDWEIIILNYATDTNNWFIADKKRIKQHLIWVQRIAAEFGMDELSDQFEAKYYGYKRENHYWNDWRPVRGSEVT